MSKFKLLFFSLTACLAVVLPAAGITVQKAQSGPLVMTVKPPTPTPTLVAAAKTADAANPAAKTKVKKAKAKKAAKAKPKAKAEKVKANPFVRVRPIIEA